MWDETKGWCRGRPGNFRGNESGLRITLPKTLNGTKIVDHLQALVVNSWYQSGRCYHSPYILCRDHSGVIKSEVIDSASVRSTALLIISAETDGICRCVVLSTTAERSWAFHGRRSVLAHKSVTPLAVIIGVGHGQTSVPSLMALQA